MPTVSIIVPTRNRVALWRRRWLLDGLYAQTDHDFELIIASDHSTDETLDHLTDTFAKDPPPFAVTLVDVIAQRPEPCPASGIPDNCLFHAASGDILLHLDDDCAVTPDAVSYAKLLPLLQPAIIWPETTFHAEDGTKLADGKGEDWRVTVIKQRSAPALDIGLFHMHAGWRTHWGAAWIIARGTILDRGGHELDWCHNHNTDTRLGTRLVLSGVQSYFSRDPRAHVQHLGQTWHMLHRSDPKALRRTEPDCTRPPAIANGGRDFWASEYFTTAYTVAARFNARA